MTLTVIPELPDRGRDGVPFERVTLIDFSSDPGSWADALRFVRFPVLDFQSIDDAGRQLTEAGSVAPDLSTHAPLSSAGGAHDHA